MGDPQPQPQVPQPMAGQLFFGQNQQEAVLGGVPAGMQFTPQHTGGAPGGMPYRPQLIRTPQQGMHFRLPEAGGAPGGMQCRPALPNQWEQLPWQPAAWNVTNTSVPQKTFAFGDSRMARHGNSSQWNSLQPRVSQNRNSWNVSSPECRTVQNMTGPQAAGFSLQPNAAGPGAAACLGTFGTAPAQTSKGQHHKQQREFSVKAPTSDRRVPGGSSARRVAPTRSRRRKRPSSSEEGPSCKMFLSEEKMAAHLNRLSISNDHAYVATATSSSGLPPPPRDQNRVVIEDLSDDSSDEWASSSDSDVGSTIQISQELQQGMQQVAGERLLPEGLFERLNRPCMEVVLWKPPQDFMKDAMKSSSLPKKQITPTTVPSEPSLLTFVNPSPSPLTCNHGEPEMIDAEVLCHVTQPDVTMFDSIDDDMDL